MVVIQFHDKLYQTLPALHFLILKPIEYKIKVDSETWE